MTTEIKSAVANSTVTELDDDWIASSGLPGSNSSGPPRPGNRRGRGLWLREWLLLDNVDGDSRRWKLSTYRIIIASSLLLCLLLAVHSFATAWTLGVVSVIATITSYYLALIVALQIGEKYPNLGAGLLLLMVYICGLLILFGVGDYALSDLGVIFLYVAPVIAWIHFGRIQALALMLVNTLPFLYMVSPERPLIPFGVDMLMPSSHLYVHSLLFLFFNLSIPLALFRVVSALNGSVNSNRQIAQRLQQSNLLYRDVFEHAGGPTLICNRGGRILRINQKACVLLGRHSNAIDSSTELTDFFAPIANGKRLDTAIQAALNNGFSEDEFLTRSTTEESKEVLLTIKSLSQRCLLVSIRDLSALRTMERDLQAANAARERLTTYDQLTNLPNRESLQESLQKLMDEPPQARRGSLLAVACLRLNSIRSINEKYGHARGDELIREFSVLLSQHRRANFQIFRLRGVVFLILVTGCSTPEQIEAVLENFIAEIPSRHTWENQSADLEVSVGVAFTRGKEISAGDLIHRGERALEIARRHAKGPLVLFSEDSAREIHREIDITLALSSALARNEFSLVYQPKVDAAKSIRGLEALIRWHSSELGHVSPAEFIPLAEHIGKIHMISEFVIEEVCRQLASWHADFGKVWPVAINLSGIDLQRDDLATFIQRALQRHQVDPAWLHLEITETGLIENDEIARRNLERLIAIGLKIAIDDFGTGYSSLKKLSEYPIHAIKIDRSFIIAIGKNPRSDRIIQLVMMLAKVLNCEVVAEGVETRRQLQFLLDNDCKRFQGYLFHKPLNRAEIGQLIAGQGEHTSQ